MRTTLKACAAATTLLMVGGLTTACSKNSADPPMRIAQRNWQVTGIFTDPEAPTSLPASVTTLPEVTFGERSATGSTGCARFQALVSYHHAEEGEDGEQTSIREANRLRLDNVRMDSPSEDCTGASAWAHGQLSALLAEGHEFEISFGTSEQLALTLIDDRVDSPALRLTSLDAGDAPAK